MGKKMIKKKILFGLFLGVFLLSFISASSFGYNYLDFGDTVIEGENYTINVNNSLYWDGHPFSFLGTTYVPYTGATQNVDLGANNLTIDTNVLFVDTTNNRVGIGTTSPGAKLTLQVGDTGNEGFLLQGSGGTARGGLKYDGTQAMLIQGLSSPGGGDIATLRFQTNPGGVLTDRLAITRDGNVGIGTASPGAKLAVYQNDEDDEDLLYLREDADGDASGFIFELSDTGISGLTSKNMVIRGISAVSDLAFSPSADTPGALVIKDGGNVGIGTTGPSELFHISKLAGADDVTAFIENTGYTSGASTRLLFSTKGTDGNLYQASISNSQSGTTAGNLVFYTHGGDRVTIQRDGNVGIGTTTPAGILEVNGATGAAGKTFRISHGTAGYYTDFDRWSIKFFAGTGSGDNYQIITNSQDWTATGGGIIFSPNNTEAMRIDKNGNVGIGTTGPASKLHVTGGDNAIRGTYGRMLQSRDEWLRINDDDQSQDYHTNGIYMDGPGVGIQTSLRVGGSDLPATGYVRAKRLEDADNTGYYVDPASTSNINNLTVNGQITTDNGSLVLGSQTGNVGIGIATPQNTLNVIGDGNFTGSLWSQGINLTALNSTGLIKDWNATGLIINWSSAETDPYWTGNYSAYNDTWTTTDLEIWNVIANDTFAYIDEPLWTDNYSAYNDSWTTTNLEIWNVIANDTFAYIDEPLWSANYSAYNDTWSSTTNTSYVPYTGANANVDLGSYNITASNYFGTFTGNSSIWSRAGTNTFLTNVGDNVGIGTASPSYTLDVNGDININGISRLRVGGSNLLYYNYTNYNLMIGATGTGASWTTANHNIVIGNAGYGLTSGNNNIIMGRQAGRTITTGVGNVILGNYAGANLPGGSTGNFAFGQESLRYGGSDNIAIGSYCGTNFKTGASNVMIGAHSGTNIDATNLAQNVFIGASSGNLQISGIGNILIGYDVQAPILDGSSQLNIGNKIYGDSVGNVGIGTTTPQNKLNVIGDGNFTGTLYAMGTGNGYPLTVGNSSNTNYSLVSAYFEGNITSAGYITRTSVFDTNKNAFDYIRDADYYKSLNKIDDSKFYGYTVWNITEIDYSKPVTNVRYDNVNCSINEKGLEEDCAIEEIEYITYPYTKIIKNEGVSIDKEIDVLRQATYELNERVKVLENENGLIKQSLCKLGEIQWCIIK